MSTTRPTSLRYDKRRIAAFGSKAKEVPVTGTVQEAAAQ